MSKLTTEIVARIEKTGAATSRECEAMAKEIRIYRGQRLALVAAYSREPGFKMPRTDYVIASLVGSINGRGK